MAVNYNKKTCIDNIYFLAKKKNLKIGELEAEVGVSAGYLSRLNKEDNKSNPSIDVIAGIANKLGTSVDVLIGEPFAELSSTEEYILRLLAKLQQDSDGDKLVWVRTLNSGLEREFLSVNFYENDAFSRCPLFKVAQDDNGDFYLGTYSAVGHQPIDCQAVNACYSAQISERSSIWVVEIDSDMGDTVWDIQMVKDDIPYPIYSTRAKKEALMNAIDFLCASIERSIIRPRIDQEVKSAIDLYMEDEEDPKLDPYDEHIPF